jgi:pimeloyl-ACP methyl ester carboxylesterase
MSRSVSVRRMVSCLALGAVLALTAACTDDPAPGPGGGDAASPKAADSKAAGAPAPAERCRQSGNTTARKMVVTTADKVELAGVAFGAGERGVLLLPQAGADLCRWWEYANELVRDGFRVLAIDLRGNGYSDSGPSADYTADAVAAVAALKKDGAKRVVVVGASLGAATALVTAARIPDEVAGVVSLSYPDNAMDVTAGTGDGPRTPIEAAPRITAPMLICFTTEDKQSAAAKPAELVAKAGSTVKQLVGRPGVSHGWDMLKLGDDDVRPDVLSFLDLYA